VIVGGVGKKRTPELTARFADEFNVGFRTLDVAAAQFERVAAACSAIGRDPAEVVRSVAHTAVVGRTDAEVAERALTIGRGRRRQGDNPLFGTVAEVVDKVGQWRSAPGSPGSTCSCSTWATSTRSSWSPRSWPRSSDSGWRRRSVKP
jgi:alkanesulfonate monooxygenase